MDWKIKNEIDNCFDYRRDPADCYGARAKTEQYLNKIDFDDDDDVKDVFDLIIRGLRMSDDNTEYVEYLMSKGFDINYKLTGKDCLILRCADNYVSAKAIARLVELGADLYSEKTDGGNILSISAARDEKLAKYIVENYDISEFDRPDKFGITPLMRAVIDGKAELAESFIAHGFDVNATGSKPLGGNSYWIEMNGVSPLALAIRHGSTKIVKALLDAGADETVCDAKGNPPIMSLIRFPFGFFRQSTYNNPIYGRKCEIVSMLKNMDLTDASGYTVLMRALVRDDYATDKTSVYANAPIISALIEKGANINAVANDGKTPLHLAVLSGSDTKKELVKAGADVNARDADGNTPLMIACKHCGEDDARWLLKKGADFKIKNNDGESAADIAAARGYADALEMMI